MNKASLFLAIATVAIGSTWLFANQEAELTPEQAKELAIEAYIYGYPLVSMDMTMQVMSQTKAPVGQFANSRTFPATDYKEVTAPNLDTLYSTAWLDLAKEPWVLHVPNEDGRYYLMPMLDGWTDVFADPGTQTTGTETADFVITGPNWAGKLPDGLKVFKSPTNMVWILGRTYTSGTPEDLATVHNIQDQYEVKPLSYYGKAYTPPKIAPNPSIDTATPVRKQVNQLDIATFFNRLSLLMKENPPSKEDGPFIAKLSQIGIIPGQPFDPSKTSPAILSVVEKLAQDRIRDHLDNGLAEQNGWTYVKIAGHYGTNYDDRALVAAVGLGANLPEDAIYPVCSHDSDKNPLNGKNNYVIHFDKGQLPPVKGFWSLTLYNDKFYFVPNDLNRHSLSQRDPFQNNPDGSIDLYLQATTPGKEKESNWLPTPKEDFVLMFRFYWPEQSILNGTWKTPPVKKV